jgi:putative ABC transport system permease protein
MNDSIQTIPYVNLALAFIPVVLVIIILWKWKIGHGNSIYAVFRMLIQLLLIGYVLSYIFKADNSLVVIGVLAVMLFSSSWIALRTMHIPRKRLYLKCFWAITSGAGIILLLITQGVLNLKPWYLPSYMIPLAGMIFASAMNSISLAGERLEAEINRNMDYDRARIVALQASLIPITNSLLAVGLVSLPGMMTGQILSGVSPFIAARYQIMVMCMMFSSAGISAAIFLALIKSEFKIEANAESAGLAIDRMSNKSE